MKIFFKTRQDMRNFTKTASAFGNSSAKDVTKVQGGQWAAVRKSNEVQGKLNLRGTK
jgi:hypothetical protein